MIACRLVGLHRGSFKALTHRIPPHTHIPFGQIRLKRPQTERVAAFWLSSAAGGVGGARAAEGRVDGCVAYFRSVRGAAGAATHTHNSVPRAA